MKILVASASMVAALAPAAVVTAPAYAQDPGCSQYGRSAFAVWNTRRVPYAIRDSVGSFARSALIEGHHTWNYSRNDCGYTDATNFTFDYIGTSSIGAHSVPDTYNRVDFGTMSNINCSNAIPACTLIWRNGSNHIYETDQRLNGSWLWEYSCGGSAPDVWNTASHESGHMLGLNDQYSASDSWLTMYYTLVATNECRKRNLGHGDVLGMRALYP